MYIYALNCYFWRWWWWLPGYVNVIQSCCTCLYSSGTPPIGCRVCICIMLMLRFLLCSECLSQMFDCTCVWAWSVVDCTCVWAWSVVCMCMCMCMCMLCGRLGLSDGSVRVECLTHAQDSKQHTQVLSFLYRSIFYLSIDFNIPFCSNHFKTFLTVNM